MRYKEGDKVVIRNDLNINEEYGYYKVDKNMEKYIGKTVTIEKVWDDTYVTVEKPSGDFFTDEMIDHEATARLNEPKYELKIDDNGVYVSYRPLEFLINSTTNKEDIRKGSDKMNANEILNTWKNKKHTELRIKAEEEKDKVSAQDEIRKLILEHKAQINKTLKEKFKVDTEVDYLFDVLFTEKTRNKLKEIEAKTKDEEDKIDKKVKEIKAVLEVAENQDKVFEILNKQGIIDKNYNIL